MQPNNHDRLVSLIPNFSPEYLASLDKLLSSVTPSDKTSSLVRIARVTKSTKGVLSASSFYTHGCHNIMKMTFSDGGEGIISLYTRTPHGKEGPFLDYFINRSPYAPWILCTTPESAKTRGFFFNSNMPPNMFASACITSRLAYTDKFCEGFAKYVEMGIHEDVAFWLAHYLREYDGAFRYTSSGEHGTFSYATNSPITAFQNYHQRNPEFLRPETFKQTTQDSTYGGVYALWGSIGTEGTTTNAYNNKIETVDKFLMRLFSFLENGTKTAFKSSYVNPFQKTVDYLARLKTNPDQLSKKIVKPSKVVEERLVWFSQQMIEKAAQPDFADSMLNLFTVTKVKAA